MAPSQVSLSLLLGASLFLAMAVGYSSATWCVCKDGLSDAVLQKTLDYACGAGADCNPIRPSGVCYNPNSVKSHCSYAVNSYFQKRNQASGTCDFGGTASITASNPSISGCSFPASASGSGSTGTTSPTITVPSTSPNTPTTSPATTTPISSTPRTTSPYTTTVPGTGSTTPSSTTTSSSYPSGIGSSVAPTGMGMNNDSQGGTTRLHSAHGTTALCWVLAGSVLLLWN